MITRSEIYKLSSLIRYSTRLRCNDESVASHSFFVLWFTKQLCEEHKVSDVIKLMAYEAAILHDVPEVYTNDITYDVKLRIPAISALIQPIEEEVVKAECSVAYGVLFNPETISQKIAKAIVKYADILSVAQYCENELSLGNSNFKLTVAETHGRLAVQDITLQQLLREWRGNNATE